MLNECIFIGNLVKDVEAKTVNSNGKNFDLYNFTIAVNGTKENDTSYFNCVAWGAKGKAIFERCGKGSKVCVLGAMHSRSYQDANNNKRVAYELLVTQCEFITLKPKEGAPVATTDDTIPFDFPNG